MPVATPASSPHPLWNRWLAFLFPPLFVLAVRLWLHWEPILPSEDGIPIGIVAIALVGAFAVGLSPVASGSRRTQRVGIVAGLAVASIMLLLEVWFVLGLAVGTAILAALAYGTWRLSRRLARRSPGWAKPLQVALVPPLMTVLLTTFPFDQYKWISPWVLHRSEIIAFEATARAAADRLHLPDDRSLTEDERNRWAVVAPLTLSITLPFRHVLRIVALEPSWQKSYGPHDVWAVWGDPTLPTFGPLDPRWMYIAWADD